jgi:hypothetical protein
MKLTNLFWYLVTPILVPYPLIWCFKYFRMGTSCFYVIRSCLADSSYFFPTTVKFLKSLILMGCTGQFVEIIVIIILIRVLLVTSKN